MVATSLCSVAYFVLRETATGLLEILEESCSIRGQSTASERGQCPIEQFNRDDRLRYHRPFERRPGSISISYHRVDVQPTAVALLCLKWKINCG